MLIIECPDGKLYPDSIINPYPSGLGLSITYFNKKFSTVDITKFNVIIILIFLFFSTNKAPNVNAINTYAPPSDVMTFIIPVKLSVLKFNTIILYAATSKSKISFSNISSSNSKKITTHKNTIIHL